MRQAQFHQFDMIRNFYESDNEYGIFCEDDIIIRNDFMEKLPMIIDDFNKLKLDVLLLGYLCNTDLLKLSNFPVLLNKENLYYLGYSGMDSVWGTQMYLISRTYAYDMLRKYSNGYAEKTLENKELTPFSADWIITKQGNHALIYPLFVIEKFDKNYSDSDQHSCHIKSYEFTYKPELFD
jgi:GR25 family glycosyltransferase involved in LPS biosynthesis